MEINEVLLAICAGEEDEAIEAFCWLYRNCWEEVFGVLSAREALCGLQIDQKKEVVDTAFRQFWEMARAGQIQDTEKDPRSLLHSIAFRRGVDLVRKNTAKKRSTTPEELKFSIEEALKASSLGSQWRLLEIRDLADKVMEDFFSWMEQQKGVCRRTAFAMAEFFPDFPGPKELHAALCDRSDYPPTYESVKKARADVLNKFREVIETKYDTR